MSPLYDFQGGNDGANPNARVIFGPDGALYGTTQQGGGAAGCSGFDGCGTVFSLRPPPAACKAALCAWKETVLYRFTGGSDGGLPSGDLIFDKAGNLYGATVWGGVEACNLGYGCGVVYELTPASGGWTERVLYSFTDGNDGKGPGGGVIFDQAGNLYGTAQSGALGRGTVYELTPGGSGWTENTIFDFQGAYGLGPGGSLLFDEYGNLFGATGSDWVQYGAGTLFEIKQSNGNWARSYEYDFGYDRPAAGVTMDAIGNLYGTAAGLSKDGSYGVVYRLTPSNGSWSYNELHRFTGGSDGGNPLCTVAVDPSGNLYGTAPIGGANNCGGFGCGVVWQLTP